MVRHDFLFDDGVTVFILLLEDEFFESLVDAIHEILPSVLGREDDVVLTRVHACLAR